MYSDVSPTLFFFTFVFMNDFAAHFVLAFIILGVFDVLKR